MDVRIDDVRPEKFSSAVTGVMRARSLDDIAREVRQLPKTLVLEPAIRKLREAGA